ncbi:MAG: DUF116 domain-containing protein, partial [Dehalococcoidia bacterium]|nr:DUF116 domain-containing protein [Dehalococcoidia bacterium]
ALGVSFEEGPLANEEAVLLEERLPYYASEEWIEQAQAPDSQEVFRSTYKAKGGLVRVALVVDSRMKRIKAAVITGDFFAYPRRAILDLEAALKDAPAEAEPVGRIVGEFFRQGRGYLPGVEPADLSRVLAEALERGEYGRYGIAPDEAGSVYTVGKPLAQMPRCSVLLLPYCAKPLACELRHEDGCIECGLCTIGGAYRLAREKGLRPISIVNYEQLQETLVKCRLEGEPAFVGACCEAFYSKHRQDFEEAGLPGVLVDIDSTTCYDLGEESLAYRGRFERQTNLRLGLLAKVMDAMAGSPQR